MFGGKEKKMGEIHEDITHCCGHIDLKQYDLTENDLGELSDLFKVFGDATRISIMFALLSHELSVGEIADKLLFHISSEY